jgi:hypothetical protein
LLRKAELRSSCVPRNAIENLVENAETSPAFRFFWGQIKRCVAFAGTVIGEETRTLIGDNPSIAFLTSRKTDDDGFLGIEFIAVFGSVD